MNISRRLFNLKNPLNNLNNISKFFYKKRITLNHLEIQKMTKVEKDFDEMTEQMDIFEDGSDIQSHFYHEYLFTALSKIFELFSIQFTQSIINNLKKRSWNKT